MAKGTAPLSSLLVQAASVSISCLWAKWASLLDQSVNYDQKSFVKPVPEWQSQSQILSEED